MAAPARPPRTRSSGGRTMMLLGVLLALAAGTIVIFIVSQATSSATQTVTVVVAKSDLPGGAILSVDTTDKNHLRIGDAFITKEVSADFAPANAFQYTTVDALNLELNNKVIVGTFYAGEILRHPDPRVVPLGTSAAGSLTNANPAQLHNGQVLMSIEVKTPAGADGKPVAVPGDVVDIISTFCNLPGAKGTGCEAQTTMQDLYIYSVQGGSIVVVVSRQQALELQYIESQSSKSEIVLRKPGDGDRVSTQPVDGSYIVSNFHF